MVCIFAGKRRESVDFRLMFVIFDSAFSQQPSDSKWQMQISRMTYML